MSVPSEFGEDDVKVIVQLAEGKSLTPEELLGYCEDRMAYFMVPRYIEFVQQFPRTETDRIRKLELKSIHEGVWDRERTGYQLKRT